jgi:hypothetical protein
MTVKANVVVFAPVTGSRAPKVHMPQHATRYMSDPSTPEWAPAEYASTCRIRNGASIGKM